ncbi:predicted protein [Naegleria gruberi]|uniref:Predicted protein n=1 Tax=Naegleria gruberi TaxID=5762 RepID=D2V822_NAEGR|nr:uncharacterized protein NAEGRDRAFT_65002 [Naegleria gruberi]EFC47102.1 predicted protein [Naegleria gruberi]|eukprot:XP_002679846.1 predicted protein [Naegleria gruberi strain NEG-M]
MFFMSERGPINNDGPLFDLIKQLESSSSSLSEITLNIDVIDQFNDDFNIQTRFIPHPFPSSSIKSQFLNLLFKYLQQTESNSMNTNNTNNNNNNIESGLNVLRLLLREYDGLDSILNIQVIEFISKLLIKYTLESTSTTRTTKLFETMNCTFKCLLNLIHHSSELRIWLCNSEEFKSQLTLLIEKIFENENAKLFIKENITILLLVIEKAFHYFSNWIENHLNKYGNIYNEDQREFLNQDNFIQVEKNLNMSISSFTFKPFFLSFIEDLFKTSYCLSVHLEKEELQEILNCFKPLVQKTIHLFTSLSVHINIRSSEIYKKSTTSDDDKEDDEDLLYHMINFKSQLKTLMKHTIQNLTEFTTLQKKEILCLVDSNSNLIPNKAILYALLGEYINYNVDSDLYTDYLTPLVGIFINCINFSDEETPTLGSEFRIIFCDWIFENTNWILNTPPHIPDYVQEYIEQRTSRNQQHEHEEEQEHDEEDIEDNEDNEQANNQTKIDALDAIDLSFKPVKCLFVGRMSDYNYNFKTMICQFLFKLCIEDVNVFSQICGPGNTLGYLAEKGLLGNLLGQ